MKDLKLKLMIPGNSFTKGFLISWTKLIGSLTRMEVPHTVVNRGGSNIFAIRNMMVAGEHEPRPWDEITPFDGEDYTHMVWIDSDQVFEPEDVYRLIDRGVDIVTPIVPISPKERLAIGNYEEGGIRYHTLSSALGMADEDGMLEVDFAGFGMIVIRKGVFEAVGYPWFKTMNGEGLYSQTIMSEDIGFCYEAKKKGFKVFCDTEVFIGHEKSIVIRAKNGQEDGTSESDQETREST